MDRPAIHSPELLLSDNCYDTYIIIIILTIIILTLCALCLCLIVSPYALSIDSRFPCPPSKVMTLTEVPMASPSAYSISVVAAYRDYAGSDVEVTFT